MKSLQICIFTALLVILHSGCYYSYEQLHNHPHSFGNEYSNHELSEYQDENLSNEQHNAILKYAPVTE